MYHTKNYVLRRAEIKGIISRALAVLRILSINALRMEIILWYLGFGVTISLSYFLRGAFCRGMVSSCFLFVPSLTISASNCSVEPGANSSGACSQLSDYVEDLGGNGPRVAAYIRISKKNQSGFSLEAQRDAINELRDKYKPRKLYVFVDQRSSKSAKDFDKLKINQILKLREGREIDELWVFNVDRMGRVCRKLLFFFLEFCDDGGIIRTPDRAYGMADLLDFIREADASQKANEARVKAVVAGKARSFKQKRWNKRGTPLGYIRKDLWLQKRPDFEPLLKEVYRLFFLTQNLNSVSKRIGTFGGLLTKALSTDQVRRILSDPVIIGKPEHTGATVIDQNLAFIDEVTFQKSLEILKKIKARCKPKRKGPMEVLAVAKPLTFLQVLEVFELHHRGCGGLVWKNGTTNDEGLWQQFFKCKCGDFWRLPPIKIDQGKQHGTVGKDSMGGLNFDNPAVLSFDKRIARKENHERSSPREKTLQKSEHSPSRGIETGALQSFENITSEKPAEMNESLSPEKRKVSPKPEPLHDLTDDPPNRSPETGGRRLERAVQLAISAKYQLKIEAFDFLKQIAATQDPTKLMKEAIRRLNDLEERPFFVERSHLEQICFGEH